MLNKQGVLAQLVERLNGIQKVRSSILLCSTQRIRPKSNFWPDSSILSNSFYVISLIPKRILCSW